MHITVNRDFCESNGICTGLVPQRLSIGDDDVLVVSPSPLTADLERAAEQAVRACPKSALSLIPDPPS
jgi:ferredoxin